MAILWTVESPNGAVSLAIHLGESSGRLTYDVFCDGVEVLADSSLGLSRTDADFADGLRFDSSSEVAQLDERYTLPHGKKLNLRGRANERTVRFLGLSGEPIEIVMRAYNDGVAFRYRFPEQGQPVTVSSEQTSFSFATDGRAWIQPAQEAQLHGPAYEAYYENGIEVGAAADAPAWNLPALFEIGSWWVLLAEADLDETYCGSRLGAAPEGRSYEIAFPHPDEGLGVGAVAPTSGRPWTMPWRVVAVSPDLSDVFETNLVRHLSRPSESEADFDWVRPGRVSWGWWANPDSPRNMDVLRSYVDLAVEMGWEFTLVDANWDVHSDQAIRDFILESQARGVGVFLWYNSGGPNNKVTEAPRDRMYDRATRRAEMAKLKEWGVAGLKIDFFHSDKQSGIQLYMDIAADAADFELMILYHGCTVPRGWSRRWPHLMTMEGVAGAEQYGARPEHTAQAPVTHTILPFTRNAVGAMDYTPVTFTDLAHPHITTTAHELALAVVFESGLQHFADSPEAYRALPREGRKFLADVPAVWDETRLLGGQPGDYIVVARRSGRHWFIGGLNGTAQSREIAVNLDQHGYMSVVQLGDGDGRDSLDIRYIDANETKVSMQPYGGFVIWPAPETPA